MHSDIAFAQLCHAEARREPSCAVCYFFRKSKPLGEDKCLRD
jgi:hypothetical protein